MLVVVGAIIIAFKEKILKAVGDLTDKSAEKLEGTIGSIRTQ